MNSFRCRCYHCAVFCYLFSVHFFFGCCMFWFHRMMLPMDRFVVLFILNSARYRIHCVPFIAHLLADLFVHHSRIPIGYLTKLGKWLFAAVVVVLAVIIEHRSVSTTNRSIGQKRYSIYLKHGMCFTNSVDSCQCQVESTIIANVCMCVSVFASFVLPNVLLCVAHSNFIIFYYCTPTHQYSQCTTTLYIFRCIIQISSSCQRLTVNLSRSLRLK